MRFTLKLACAAVLTLILFTAVPTCNTYQRFNAARMRYDAAAAKYTNEIMRTQAVTPQTQAELDRAAREYRVTLERWERAQWW